jgi:hypothetical protein
MGWSYDSAKVKSQLSEFEAFLDHARHDKPAGLGDLFSRPFQHPAETPVTLQPQQTMGSNYYLLQLGQLYEAGLINNQQLNIAVNNIYTR